MQKHRDPDFSRRKILMPYRFSKSVHCLFFLFFISPDKSKRKKLFLFPFNEIFLFFYFLNFTFYTFFILFQILNSIFYFQYYLLFKIETKELVQFIFWLLIENFVTKFEILYNKKRKIVNVKKINKIFDLKRKEGRFLKRKSVSFGCKFKN